MITGKIDNRQSWEKQRFYKLNNGWTAIVEYNLHYGDHISGIYKTGDKNTKWSACNRLCRKKWPDDLLFGIDLPDFAKGWSEEVAGGSILIRPKFKIIH